MKPMSQINVQDYVEIALRRKWLIILPFVILTIVGIIYSLVASPMYQASTLILVEQQRVPENYIQPTVSSDLGQRLHTISQQIMSRTRLESIIKELDLYVDLRKEVFLEEIIEMMRKDINVEVRGNSSFQLSYQGRDPKVVATVTNRLASFFIEENLKFREDVADGTTEFLDRELSRVKNQLEQHEGLIAAFKARNIGGLPEQLGANLGTLQRLQTELQTVSTSLESAKERKDRLQAQISNLAAQADTNYGEGEVTETGGANVSLAQLQDLLARLQTRYKDKHPDVIRVKNQINKVEEEARKQEEQTAAEIKEEPLAGTVAADSRNTALSASGAPYGSLGDSLAGELEGLSHEIRGLEAEQGKVREKIAIYQKRVEETPKLEQELQGIERDYGNTRKNYYSLLNKKLNAQVAANMEKVQKGQRFKVLDPAQVPEKPFRPNRQKIVLLAILLGLGVGFGLGFGVEYLDQSFRDIDDLEQFLKLPVLASIPRIVTDKDIKRNKTKSRIAWASSFSVIVLVIALVLIHLFVARLDFWVAR